MMIEDYAQAIGKIVANLQGLELLIRSFLHDTLDAQNGAHQQPFPLDVAVGIELPADHLTNYDTLGKLIDKYNEVNPPINKYLVDLRDALAHGRVLGEIESSHYRLLKFSKPVNGRVKVTHNEELTEEWLKSRLEMTYTAIKEVVYRSSALRKPGGVEVAE
ncbi:hypothetical protein LOY49_12450 [Pseudomonas atacamensis]|uniref:hypothetical protein n=1 Tax=Pseudomonas atacamensis TaxID=2565368 RepID=UPI00216052E3|nr:hypothetical protein [Pseudomonas atacamensis]UVK96093.1 hypothetical protein LOY49_12450 [Pseudomonas atacamensis]